MEKLKHWLVTQHRQVLNLKGKELSNRFFQVNEHFFFHMTKTKKRYSYYNRSFLLHLVYNFMMLQEKNADPILKYHIQSYTIKTYNYWHWKIFFHFKQKIQMNFKYIRKWSEKKSQQRKTLSEDRNVIWFKLDMCKQWLLLHILLYLIKVFQTRYNWW